MAEITTATLAARWREDKARFLQAVTALRLPDDTALKARAVAATEDLAESSRLLADSAAARRFADPAPLRKLTRLLPRNLLGKLSPSFIELLEECEDSLANLAAVERTEGSTPPGRRPSSRMEKRACALLLLNKHPDWSNIRIAKEAGVARTTLNRWHEFVRARRRERIQPRDGYRTDHGIEAVADPERDT